jgi:hypothetical protein
MAGHGVAGHKNEYTTGVRVGNWCEDAQGISQVSRHTVERVPFQGETETKATFVPPWRMPQPKSTGKTLDATLLSEGGVSNDPNKLFRHEHADFKSDDDRFTTTYVPCAILTPLSRSCFGIERVVTRSLLAGVKLHIAVLMNIYKTTVPMHNRDTKSRR